MDNETKYILSFSKAVGDPILSYLGRHGCTSDGCASLSISVSRGDRLGPGGNSILRVAATVLFGVAFVQGN